jgi:hypothetical protein
LGEETLEGGTDVGLVGCDDDLEAGIEEELKIDLWVSSSRSRGEVVQASKTQELVMEGCRGGNDERIPPDDIERSALGQQATAPEGGGAAVAGLCRERLGSGAAVEESANQLAGGGEALARRDIEGANRSAEPDELLHYTGIAAGRGGKDEIGSQGDDLLDVVGVEGGTPGCLRGVVSVRWSGDHQLAGTEGEGKFSDVRGEWEQARD